ncbi:ParA family protein [Thermodesulfobacteriota bacterium]
MGQSTEIVAVANEKGGVGKTVTVINLGAALSLMGKAVLVVDMDPQANATKGLGVKTEDVKFSTYDMITRPASFSFTDGITNTRWERLDLIPAHIDLAGAEIELANKIGRENRLREALEKLPVRYDYVLLDTPPSLSLLTVNVFACAGKVLVPCQTHPYSFDALTELFDTIQTIKKYINKDLNVIGILATFFDKRTRVSHRILEKLTSDDRYGPYLFDTIIRINTTIAESAATGKPVVFFRKGSFGAMDFISLAEEIHVRVKNS